jgi:hypothetical protein
MQISNGLKKFLRYGFLLHIWVKGELIQDELIFINLVDIPSYPEEFLGLRDFIMFSVSLVGF